MTKFTFTNISNDLTPQDVANILNQKGNSISPELKLKPISFLEPYYRDNIPQTNGLDGVLIKLPIYGNRFITLSPNETVEISTEELLEIDFYNDVIKAFTSDVKYPIMHCEVADDPTPPGPTPPIVTDLPYTFSISDFTEYQLEEDYYHAFYIKAGRINLSTEKQYVMTLVVGGQNYSAVSKSVEKLKDTESAIEADFVFFDIPQEIDNALGSVQILDGIYANMIEMDMREDNDFTVIFSINGGHRLSELSSIEGITISEYTE